MIALCFGYRVIVDLTRVFRVMFVVYLSLISLIAFPVFFVTIIVGLVKKNKKTKILGGIGCVASLLFFVVSISLQVVYSESIKEAVIETQQQDLQRFVDSHR